VAIARIVLGFLKNIQSALALCLAGEGGQLRVTFDQMGDAHTGYCV
jgi:hypothetical protein